MPEISERPTAARNVLLECDDPMLHDGITRVLQEAGCDVVSCAGPASRSSRTCPLVTDGRCTVVERADLVVHALDQTDAAHRDVLTTLLARNPQTDVVVEADTLQAGDAQAPTPDARVRTVPTFTRGTLLDALAEATSDAQQLPHLAEEP
jgi:hypothetical protein